MLIPIPIGYSDSERFHPGPGLLFVLLYYLYYLVQQPQHASEVTDPDASPAEIDDPLERQRLTASHNTGTYSAATKDTKPAERKALRESATAAGLTNANASRK